MLQSKKNIKGLEIAMEYQYEYFASAALELPKNAWLPFASACAPHLHRKNKILYTQGDNATAFYYIVSGSVRTFISSEGGGERILTVYKSGDILGEAAFFDEMPRVSSAQILTDSKIISIDKSTLERCMKENPTLAFSLLKYLSGTVRMLSTQLDTMAFLPADKRIARLLVNLQNDKSHIINCSHEELGYAVGVSRVTVSRILGNFEKQGLIKLEYRKIIITNAKALKTYHKE